MPSGPVAESESRFESKLSTLSGEKDTESRDSWVIAQELRMDKFPEDCLLTIARDTPCQQKRRYPMHIYREKIGVLPHPERLIIFTP